MNRGFYNVLNYSDLSDDYILDNINFIIKIIRNGQYILSSNSPKNIKNNYENLKDADEITLEVYRDSIIKKYETLEDLLKEIAKEVL